MGDVLELQPPAKHAVLQATRYYWVYTQTTDRWTFTKIEAGELFELVSFRGATARRGPNAMRENWSEWFNTMHLDVEILAEMLTAPWVMPEQEN